MVLTRGQKKAEQQQKVKSKATKAWEEMAKNAVVAVPILDINTAVALPISVQLIGMPFQMQQRQQALQQIADDIGLRLNALLFGPAEEYFYSLTTNVGICLALRINVLQRMAKISYQPPRHATFTGPSFSTLEVCSFVWPLSDWHQFLLGVRGIFLLFFVGCPRIRAELMNPTAIKNDGTQMAKMSDGPIIEEPPTEDEEDGGGEAEEHQQSAENKFSVTVSHNDLRLERIAADLMLRLVCIPGKHIQFFPTAAVADECDARNCLLTFEDFIVPNDEKGWIRVIEQQKKKGATKHEELSTEHWLKISRELFTYAIIGKCAAVFDTIFPCGGD